MTKHDDPGHDGGAGPLGGGTGENPAPPGQVANVVDEALRAMQRDQAGNPPPPMGIRDPGARTLQAYVDRRKRLVALIRAENPTCTEEYIEARLEQFGA
jgi:hypothetical protein